MIVIDMDMPTSCRDCYMMCADIKRNHTKRPKDCPIKCDIEDIRAEIDDIEEGISSYHNDRPWVFKDEVLQIIDKYR